MKGGVDYLGYFLKGTSIFPVNVWLPESLNWLVLQFHGTNKHPSCFPRLIRDQYLQVGMVRRCPCCRYVGRNFAAKIEVFFFAVWTCLSQIHAQISISAETNWEDKQPSTPASAKEQRIEWHKNHMTYMTLLWFRKRNGHVCYICLDCVL